MRKELGHIMITAQLLPARAPALGLIAPPPAGHGQGRGVEQCCSWVIPSSHHPIITQLDQGQDLEK